MRSTGLGTGGIAGTDQQGRYDLVKHRIHNLLDEPNRIDRWAVLVQAVIAASIIINTLAIVLFTVPSINDRYECLLTPIITICVGIFTIEYLLRLWSCTSARLMKDRIRDRVRYALGLYQIIDLISIVPFLIPSVAPRHLALVRTLRIVSIFKLGRYSRYSSSLDQLTRVLLRKQEIFGIMIFFLVFIVLFSSTIMYLVEHPVQPDKFSSIPAAMWWAIMTVTTVGYGDIIPVTPLGKIIGSVCTVTGVLVLALPSAILATGFIEEREKEKRERMSDRKSACGNLIRLLAEHRDQGKITEQEYEAYLVIIRQIEHDL